MNPWLRTNDAGQVTIRWFRVALLVLVWLCSFLILGWAVHYFTGRPLRIANGLFSFSALLLSFGIGLYWAIRRAQGKATRQFSLMAMFVVLTIVCLFLGAASWQRQTDLELYAHRKRLQTEIMDIVGQGHAHVSGPTLVQVKRPAFNDDDLAKILRLQPQLKEVGSPIYFVDFSGTQITDAGAASLGKIDTLEYCYLSKTRVGDASLAELKDLSNLKILGLDATRVTNEGMLKLSKLRPQLDIDPKTYRRLNNKAASPRPGAK